MQDYRRHGVSFQYPSGWELTEEGNEQERTITLQTAGASFWTITLFADRPEPEQLLESVLQAYRDDYDDVDVYPQPGEAGLLPSAGADLDFVYLDLVNSVSVRAFQTADRSAVVIFRGRTRSWRC
ncbi:MAG: hypothetical protein U0872_03660 [Planctomycetaceae bacterium]